jgi:hypothetical protein
MLPEDANLILSQLFSDAWLDPDMPDVRLELAYDDEGAQVRILDTAGGELAAGPVGTVLDIGLLRPTPQRPPSEDRRSGHGIG